MDAVGISTAPELSLVVPLYNEEENLPEHYRRTVAALETKQRPFYIVGRISQANAAAAPTQIPPFQNAA